MAKATYPPPPPYYKLYKDYLQDPKSAPEQQPPIEGTYICYGANYTMLGKDLLVVVWDSGKLLVLSFCNEMHRFFPVTHGQLSNPGNSRNQLARMLAIDSRCQISSLACCSVSPMIFVKTPTGKTITLEVDTIDNVKAKIQPCNIPLFSR